MFFLQKILKEGNILAFNGLVEKEALTLHAMMMTSDPYFMLFKPNTLNIIREASEQGALFGSVSARDIVIEMKSENIEINAKDVIMKSNIKIIGEFRIKLVLHPEVSKEVIVKVEKATESPKN